MSNNNQALWFTITDLVSSVEDKNMKQVMEVWLSIICKYDLQDEVAASIFLGVGKGEELYYAIDAAMKEYNI